MRVVGLATLPPLLKGTVCSDGLQNISTAKGGATLSTSNACLPGHEK